MDSSPGRPRYTVSVRLPAPENLKEKITAGLVEAVKRRQTRRQAQQSSGPGSEATEAANASTNPPGQQVISDANSFYPQSAPPVTPAT